MTVKRNVRKNYYTLHDKNHIYEVLDYLRKLKKIKKILSFHQRLGWIEDRISHSQKLQNKNFLVSSKYHLSINFLAQQRPCFSFPKGSNNNFSVISKYHIPLNFLTKRNPAFSISKTLKTRTFQ